MTRSRLSFPEVPRGGIAILCTLVQLCLGTVYAWSYFQVMLVRQAGWTYTETAWAFSTTIFCVGISAAWAGQALPRLGPRKLAVTGSLLFSGGYAIAALSLRLDSLWLFYLGYGVIGGAGIGLGYVTPVATVAKWFPDRKGLMTGTVVMGFGVGALLLSKILAPLLVARTEGDLASVFLWLGVVFAAILVPSSILLRNPPEEGETEAVAAAGHGVRELGHEPIGPYLRSGKFAVMWMVFFFNIAAGISVISFQSELLQEVWGLADPTIEPAVLADYGATLIAASSVCNGLGRLFFGLLSDRIGRASVFKLLLASQMVVFGVLMTETNPWVFSALVCYVLLCFGGGFATMPSFVLEVFGIKRMAQVYGAMLSAWAVAGTFGPLYVGYLKDAYPSRAVMYCFLVGILMLGCGYLFSYLLSDERIRFRGPTVESTLRRLQIPIRPRVGSGL